MSIQTLSGVRIEAVCACLPKRVEDNFDRCLEVYGSEERAKSVVTATGIRTRRIAQAGVTSLDLCVRAAEGLLEDVKCAKDDIGAVIAVTFTPERNMPCNACQAQKRLGLSSDVIAFDIGLACSGYAYGLYVAGMIARSTNRKVLLLDGDVQSPVVRQDDEATVPVLADAGTATLVEPCDDARPWSFSFMSMGEGGEALTLPFGGKIAMDGFAVFKFVATDVSRFIKAFMGECGISPDDVDRFVPHQANVYMIRQLTKTLKMPAEKLCVSGDAVGNSASATVPVTIAWTQARGRVLLSGFGGGLSASVALVEIGSDVKLRTLEV